MGELSPEPVRLVRSVVPGRTSERPPSQWSTLGFDHQQARGQSFEFESGCIWVNGSWPETRSNGLSATAANKDTHIGGVLPSGICMIPLNEMTIMMIP